MLDHILATNQMVSDGMSFDVVHMNSEFADSTRYTDHDPVLARFTIPQVTVQFSIASYSTPELGVTFVVTATLNAYAAVPVNVNYATSDGTATAGADYTATNGTLTFNPTETQKTFTIQILTDQITEPTETVQLTLSSAVNATLGALFQAILNIVDNDLAVWYFPVIFNSAP